MNMTDNCCYLLRQMSTPVSKQNLTIYLSHQNPQMNNEVNDNFKQNFFDFEQKFSKCKFFSF